MVKEIMLKMENKSAAAKQTAALALLEIAVSAIVCLVYFLVGHFSFKVITGALLGSAVTVANFIFLAVSVNRAVDRYLELRGTREMDEEEAEKFAIENKASLMAAQKISYIVRMLSIALTLVLALLLRDVFDVIATVVPLLMLRPMLTVSQLVKAKKDKNQDISGKE